MRIRTIAATALLSAAAVTITSGTAGADPAVPETISGSTYGIGYQISQDDADTFTTTLIGGTFRRADHGIDVLTAAGDVVAHLPLRIALDERHDAELAPRVEGNRLIADVSAKDVGYWRKTSPWQRSMEAGVAIGGLGGALVGGFLGMVLGIATGGIGLVLTLPIGLIGGLLGGMALGGAAGAAIPNSQEPDQWGYVEECEYYGDAKFCW